MSDSPKSASEALSKFEVLSKLEDVPQPLKDRNITLEKLLRLASTLPSIYINGLPRKELELVALLDGSISMNGQNAQQTKAVMSGIGHKVAHITTFGNDLDFDPRNNDGYTTVDTILNGKFMYSSYTHPNAIPSAFRKMHTDRGEKLLLVIMDGQFTGGPGTFKKVIEKAARENLLDGIMKIVLMFPSSVSENTKNILQVENSHMLALSRHKIEMISMTLPREIVTDQMALNNVCTTLLGHLSIPCVPKGYIGISDSKRDYIVDGSYSASQLNQAFEQQCPQILDQVMRILLKTIEFSALTVLVNDAYLKMHFIIMANTSSQLDYVHKIGQIMGRKVSDTREIELLRELKRCTHANKSSQLMSMVAEKSATSFLHLTLHDKTGHPLDPKKIMDMCTKAVVDSSSYSLKELLECAFGTQAKVEIKDNSNTGFPIPNKKQCEEHGLDYREILLIAFRRFFLAFGQDYKQIINGQILFTLCLFLVGSPDLEVPEVIKDLAKTILFDEKYLLSNLGLISGSSDKSEDVKIPDSWFVPAIMYAVFNLVRMPDFPKIATFQKILPQLERVWMTFRFRNVVGKLLDHLPSVKNPYQVLKVEDRRTFFLYSKPDTSDWVIPDPGLPNFLADGLFPGVVVGETYNGLVSGARSLTWMDNPATEKLHAIMIKSAEEHFLHKYSDGKTQNKKTKKWNKKLCASLHAPLSLKEGCEIDDCKQGANKPLGTDFVHLPLKKLVVLGAVSEEKKKEIMEMFAGRFGKWRAEDLWQNLSEGEIKKRCTSRTQEIIDYFATLTLPKKTRFRKLTKKEAFSLIVAMYPHLEPFRDNYWPTKRSDVEDIAAQLDSKTFKKVLPKELKKDDPALTLNISHNADVVKVDIGYLRDEVSKVYREAMAPPPVTESATTAECCSCMGEYGRASGERVWLPCGHVLCKSCHSSIMALIDKSIDDTKTDETAGIAMNLCQCPICRVHPILPQTDKYATLRTFFDSKTSVVTGGIYRDCKECKGIFQAGHKNCLGHPGAIQKTCEKCSQVHCFTCPRVFEDGKVCGIKAQHGGGCRMMRCCGAGGYHCPAERGVYCSHCTCGDSMCTDPSHTKGCGMEFTIDEAIAALGNGGDSMGMAEMQERVQQGADA
jgi:hypothetical protein